MSSSWLRFVGLLTGLVILGSLLSPGKVYAASCTDFGFIGARGSGQAPQPKQPGARADLGMGPEVADVYHALAELLPGRVSATPVRYPAVAQTITTMLGAGLHIGVLGRYTASVREGTNDAIHRLEGLHRACPGMRFILAGYSQGAQAVGDALQRMPAEDRALVAGAAFFGDPYFNAGSWSARSSFDPSFYGALGVRGEWPEALHGRVFSYCHRDDPICNLSNRHHILGDGTVYVRNPTHVDVPAHVTPAYRRASKGGRGDADDAARELARVLGANPPSPPYRGPLDIAFVIDSTGSMAGVIDAVKSNVAALVSAIAAIDPNFRVALVDYKDDPADDSPYQARLDLDFTMSVDAFHQALDTLTAQGGGDPPESVYSGIMTALGLQWRAGAKKLIVQIGDAPAKDPEPVTGFTLASVRAKALSVDPAAVDTLLSGDSSDARASFAAIAAATGGTALVVPSGSPLSTLVTAIVAAVRRAATAPTAALRPPSQAVAGVPATFSAAASVDRGEPIVAYDWDFNGDGVYDQTTADPVVAFTYPGALSTRVVVRVRAGSGLAALAAARVKVRAPATRRPGRPRKLRAHARDHRIRLTWRRGRGAPARWFTIYRRRKVVARVAARAGGRPPRRFELRGVRRGRRFRFRVSAGNERGESRPSRAIAVRVPRHRAGR